MNLPGWPAQIRQAAVTDIGHEGPFLLLANDPATSVPELVDHYSPRLPNENAIAEAVKSHQLSVRAAGTNANFIFP